MANAKSEKSFSLERVIQVWDDSTGERLEVGNDPDGKGLVEIRMCDGTGKVASLVAIDPGMVPVLQEALTQFVAA